ncbi:MAG: hypothetical protein ACHQHN_04160 [Sphingobacteriales bacterium]
MKKFIIIITVFITAAGLFSCKNSAVDPPANTILGKWNIKVDTTMTGIGPVQTAQIYLGKSGDYFDFRSNHKLYIKEGATLDTFAYKVVADNKITISIVGSSDIAENCFIDALSPTSATINFFPYLVNPGGNTAKVVYLTR